MSIFQGGNPLTADAVDVTTVATHMVGIGAIVIGENGEYINMRGEILTVVTTDNAGTLNYSFTGTATTVAVTGIESAVFSAGNNFQSLGGGGGTTINTTNNTLPVRTSATAFGDSGITQEDGGGSLTYQPAVPFTGTVEQNQVGGILQQDSDLVIASTSSAFSGAVASGSAWSTVTYVHFDSRNSGSFWERTENTASGAFVQGITTNSFIVLYTDNNNWAVISPISTTQVAGSLNVSIEASMGVTPTIGNQITIGFVPSATYPFPSDEIRIAGDLTVTGTINVGTVPTGAGTAPAGLAIGDVWGDTTAGSTAHPVLRVATVTT